MDVTIIRIIAGVAIVFPFVVVPFWKIFSKAGFPNWLSLLMVVPIVNAIVLYYVAFSRWRTTQSR